MDRFIAVQIELNSNYTLLFKIQYGQIYSQYNTSVGVHQYYLKSNMDRFIGNPCKILVILSFDLKSNMDRFIDVNNNALMYYITI